MRKLKLIVVKLDDEIKNMIICQISTRSRKVRFFNISCFNYVFDLTQLLDNNHPTSLLAHPHEKREKRES